MHGQAPRKLSLIRFIGIVDRALSAAARGIEELSGSGVGGGAERKSRQRHSLHHVSLLDFPTDSNHASASHRHRIRSLNQSPTSSTESIADRLPTLVFPTTHNSYLYYTFFSPLGVLRLRDICPVLTPRIQISGVWKFA